MYFRKLSSLVLAAFASFVLVAPSISSTDQPRHDQQVLGVPFHPQVADGGAPVPPYPPKSSFRALTADGGAPVPPYPKAPAINLTADGGAPVPSYPQPPIPAPSVSSKPQSTLLADGGAPVPPYPPKSASVNFLAI
jgi:hypothetical protein